MLMHALEVLCNEPWCCILCWQFDMQFSYATLLAHPVLCRPTHFNISGYASGSHCHDKNRCESYVSKKKNPIWATFTCSVNVDVKLEDAVSDSSLIKMLGNGMVHPE